MNQKTRCLSSRFFLLNSRIRLSSKAHFGESPSSELHIHLQMIAPAIVRMIAIKTVAKMWLWCWPWSIISVSRQRIDFAPVQARFTMEQASCTEFPYSGFGLTETLVSRWAACAASIPNTPNTLTAEHPGPGGTTEGHRCAYVNHRELQHVRSFNEKPKPRRHSHALHVDRLCHGHGSDVHGHASAGGRISCGAPGAH